MLFRVRSTWDYGVRGPHNFWDAPVAQQPLPSLVLKLLLQLTTVQTVRTACTTVQADPVHYPVKFDADSLSLSSSELLTFFYFT